MQFIIRDNTRKFNCIEFIKGLTYSPLMGVRIGEYTRNRTKAQNNTFHWWVDIIAKEQGYKPKQIKEELKLACFGTFQREVKGVMLTELKSSASLTTHDFSTLMAATEMLARELNVILPYPDDYLDTMR